MEKQETVEAPKPVTKVDKVVVHPLVLLSVVDHFNRMGKIGNVKRVVGILLGSNRQGVLDISNSFAGNYHKNIHFNILFLFCNLFTDMTLSPVSFYYRPPAFCARLNSYRALK